MPRRSATCLTPRYSVVIVAFLAVDDSGRETHDSGRETEAARYYRAAGQCADQGHGTEYHGDDSEDQ
nr:MAG TPA: hypothetical protein [Caudoviricetes sp.]